MSLIASVLKLDRAAVKALRITDPYSLHRVVYGLYPDVRDAGGKAGHTPSGILHADQGGDFHSRNILLLADRPKRGFTVGMLITGALGFGTAGITCPPITTGKEPLAP